MLSSDLGECGGRLVDEGSGIHLVRCENFDRLVQQARYRLGWVVAVVG